MRGKTMEVIQSAQNKTIKHIKKLHKKKYREESLEYLIEGRHLVEEALQYAREEIIQLVMTVDMYEEFSELKNIDILFISTQLSNTLSATPSPQNIFARMRMKTTVLDEEFTGPILLLDNVQDPGNVGTIIRTADAANYQSVILGHGSADLYNDKVLRSMQGSNFHLSVYQADLHSIILNLKDSGYVLYGTELNEQAKQYQQITPPDRYALVMGNEGNGVSAEILSEMTENIYIPIEGKAESLNVSVAAGILMYYLKFEAN